MNEEHDTTENQPITLDESERAKRLADLEGLTRIYGRVLERYFREPPRPIVAEDDGRQAPG